MRKIALGVIVALALAGSTFAALVIWPIGQPERLAPVTGSAERGAYLARMAGCIGCHSDFKAGGAPLAGGVRFETPFGVFYAPNLTTDKDSGIGAWTLEDFATALRQGIAPNGRPYYPAFPYAFYADLSDQDIADLWAAFQTVPADTTASKAHDLVFPFNIRAGLKLWRAFALDEVDRTAQMEKSAIWRRGQFIVEGPGHCGACHTSRNWLGMRKASQRLGGSDDLPGGEAAPSIRADALRAKGWDRAILIEALASGLTPKGDLFGGSMGEVVRESTRFLTREDRAAIATYLLNLEE